MATAYLFNAASRSNMMDFVATVSHELRTPLTSIAGYVELLEDQAGSTLTPLQCGFLSAVGRNSVRLTELADDLLTATRLQSGEAARAHRDLDLNDVVRSSRRSLESTIAARRLTVTFEVSTDPVPVYGDAADLESMISNLLTNAVKFTCDGGWVRCAVARVDGRAQVTVSDNGLGILQAEQGHLFRRFFRSSTAEQHAIRGTGLGLNIVQAIARDHGGEVTFTSEHLVGSTFVVRIPLCPAPS